MSSPDLPYRIPSPFRRAPGLRREPDDQTAAHGGDEGDAVSGQYLIPALASCAVGLYLGFYCFEAPLRYVLHTRGLDSLIFVRDAILLLPVFVVAARQLVYSRLHPVFLIFLFIVVLHGLVMALNIGSAKAVFYAAKMLSSMLAGAILAPILMNPSRRFLVYLAILWVSLCLGLFLDKYVLTFPWAGMQTVIDNMVVDVNRNWSITDQLGRRASGFPRSSISAASMLTLLTAVLSFHLRSVTARCSVAIGALIALVWTTQKAPLLGVACLAVIFVIPGRRRVSALKLAIIFFAVAAIVLPTVLPQYHMPASAGSQFSMMSFNMRVEQMWPAAWEWITRHEAFPFGVGLGGIGGAQRVYAENSVNAADNLFVFLYANFGIMAFIYIISVLFLTCGVKNTAGSSTVQALAICMLFFIVGCAESMLEDQMFSLFFGAAVSWLYHYAVSRPRSPPTFSSAYNC